MYLEVSPKKVLKVHMAIIFLLLIANCISVLLYIKYNHDWGYGFIPMFNFDDERNIPTLFSSFSHIACSLLLLLIAFNKRLEKASYIPWLILSFIFIFLSIDEVASIHERLNAPIKETYKPTGILFFAWVIPYMIGLVLFVAAYTKFLLTLPKRIMCLFILSGFTFVFGAIGFEMLGAKEVESFGYGTVVYSVLFTCEEFLEMTGIALFIYTLLSYLATDSNGLSIKVCE